MNLNNEIDDAGHFEHDVKVIRVKVLQEAVKKLIKKFHKMELISGDNAEFEIRNAFGDKLVEKEK